MAELEAVRIVADWLADATYGVNAELAAVPRDDGDAAPAAVVTVADETRDNVVARDRPADSGEGPTLSVLFADGQFEGEVLTNTARDGEVTVLVRYNAADPESAEAKQDASYTLRAVRRSLRVLNSNDHVARRTRNGIVLTQCRSLRPVRTQAHVGSDQITSGLLVTFAVRDRAP